MRRSRIVIFALALVALTAMSGSPSGAHRTIQSRGATSPEAAAKQLMAATLDHDISAMRAITATQRAQCPASTEGPRTLAWVLPAPGQRIVAHSERVGSVWKVWLHHADGGWSSPVQVVRYEHRYWVC
jgi:hypothetical protein